MQTIVTYFKDNVSGFSDTWDNYVTISDGGKVELKGDLSEIQDEINNTIDQYQLLANSSALSELQTENSKSIISARKNQSELLSELNSKQTQIENKLKQSGKTYSWLISQYKKYKDNSVKADDRIDAKIILKQF